MKWVGDISEFGFVDSMLLGVEETVKKGVADRNGLFKERVCVRKT